MKGYGINPWLVEDLDEFYFLCCPECAYKSKDDEAFMDHAVENHPKSKASSVFSEAEQKLSKQKTVLNLPKSVKVIPKTIKVVPKTKNVASIDNAEERAYKSKNNEEFIAVENLPKSKGYSVGSEAELELSKNVFREVLELSKQKTVSNLENSVKSIDIKVENNPKSKAFSIFSEIEELCKQKTVSNVEESVKSIGKKIKIENLPEPEKSSVFSELDELVKKKTDQNLKEISALKAILQGEGAVKVISIPKNVATIEIPEEEKTKEKELVPDDFAAVESIKYDYIDGKLIRKKTCEKSKQKTVKVATIDMPKGQ